MLAMTDKNGRVWGSIPGLANRAQVSVDDTETALNKFLSPDKYSRTTDHEGRRIEVIDGGWRLLNHAKYRAIRDEEERKEYKKDWIANKRAADKAVDNVDPSRPQYTNTDPDPYTDPLKTTTDSDDAFNLAWKIYPRRAGGNPKGKAQKAWDARIKSGADWHDLWDGLIRYREFCKATGKWRTEYVKQAATFFGPDKHYLEKWEIPDEPKTESLMDRVYRENGTGPQSSGMVLDEDGTVIRPEMDQRPRDIPH